MNLNSRILGSSEKKLVILHGFLGSLDNWITIGRELEQLNLEVHLVDLRNHGKSFHSKDFSYDYMCFDLKKYLDSKNIKKTSILGHSMGGKVVFSFLENHENYLDKTIIADILPIEYKNSYYNIFQSLKSINPRTLTKRIEFEEHLKNAFAQATKLSGIKYEIPPVWYEQPIYYKGNRLSFVGHKAEIKWPSFSEFLDIELEIAAIIGKKGRDIQEEDASDYIFGYSILNDISARDAQMKEMPGQMGPAKSKDFDTGNVLGPFILTADEVDHPVALNMEARVNGSVWGGGNSKDMHHSFSDIIAHISRSETIYPGEVIGSGTVGTGSGIESGKKLAPGDEFELEIEKIGTLSNKIVRTGL